jgi:hypothetical protein
MCPITSQIFRNPVITIDGHVYEKDAITSWFAGGKKTSPNTGLNLSTTQTYPCLYVKNSVDIYFKDNPERKTDQ